MFVWFAWAYAGGGGGEVGDSKLMIFITIFKYISLLYLIYV